MTMFGLQRTETLRGIGPIEVFFQGWRSTTYDLQQAGWELGKHNNQCTYETIFTFRNKHLSLGAICELWRPQGNPPPPIYVNQIVNPSSTQMVIQGEVPKIQWLDEGPEAVYQQNVSGEVFFQTKELPAVYVEEADMDVVDHLQSILDSQADKQRELRERSRSLQTSSSQATSKIIQQIVKVT